MKAAISGLINIESTLQVRGFPIPYYPVDYPFFGIRSGVAGVAYNVAKALQTLGDEISLYSMIGKDEEGGRILKKLRRDGISTENIRENLEETPVTIALYDGQGRRQIYCDLKDIQEQTPEEGSFEQALADCDFAVLCNTNFNRAFIKKAKELSRPIATDVHVLEQLEDGYNRDFLEAADLLFLSDEKLPDRPEKFLFSLKERYPARVIVIGLGEKGALLYDRRAGKGYFLEAAGLGNVVNTLGAGDALFSGFLHFYGKSYPAVDALVRAELFAAKKIQHDGAAEGFCSEEEIEGLEKKIGVRVLE